MRKLFKMLLKYVYCCHLLSPRYVHSFQNKYLLEIFPFLYKNCQKMGNIKTGTEIVNLCIKKNPVNQPQIKVSEMKTTNDQRNL